MDTIKDAYSQIQGFMELDKSKCTYVYRPPDNSTEYTQLEFQPHWLENYQTSYYPSCINTLARINPTIESCVDNNTHKLIISWLLDDILLESDKPSSQLIKADADSYFSDDNIDKKISNIDARDLCRKIKNIHSKAECLIVVMTGDDVMCFAGKDSHDLSVDVTLVMDDFEIDDYNIHSVLSHIANDISRNIFGKRYHSISRYGAYVMCQKLITHIANGNGNKLITNPSTSMRNMLKEDVCFFSDKYSEKDTDMLYDDIENMAALFGTCYAPNSAYNVIANIIRRSSLNKYLIDKLANIMADMMYDRAYEMETKSGKQCIPDRTPKQIYELISESVINQNTAVKAASMLIYNHLHGHSKNMVMIGPTGCGKTEIWRKMSEIYPFISIVDGSRLTPEGWKGDYKIASAFLSADPQYVNNLILVIDEIDKLFEPNLDSNGNDHSILIENEMLKLMEHKKGNIASYSADRQPPIMVDLSNISVVLCGSFTRMVHLKKKADNKHPLGFGTEDNSASNQHSKYTVQDLIKYGNIRDEIAGRINQIIELNSMTADDFESIINHKTASPIHLLEKEMNITIRVSKSAKKKLAAYAALTGLGCRAITSKLTQCLDDAMFENPDCGTYDLSNAVIKSMQDPAY